MPPGGPDMYHRPTTCDLHPRQSQLLLRGDRGLTADWMCLGYAPRDDSRALYGFVYSGLQIFFELRAELKLAMAFDHGIADIHILWAFFRVKLYFRVFIPSFLSFLLLVLCVCLFGIFSNIDLADHMSVT